MNIQHSYPSPPRLVVSGGPVSRALRLMQDADPERAKIRALRRAIADRIEADIALLDALAGDPDFEPDADTEATAAEWSGLAAHRFNVGEAA